MGTAYKVVLLDMDGTFLDSRGTGAIPNEWAYDALAKSLRHFGVALTVEVIDASFLAPLRSEGADGVRRFCVRFGLDCDEFWARREKDVIEAKIEAIRRGEITLCNGSEEIIRYLSTRFQLAVVSDSQQACVDYALDYFNLKSYFTIWYGRKSDLESLTRRKPNPFYINRVLRELNAPREAAILADDSPIGILAAQNAGIDSVLICHNDEKRLTYDYAPTFSIKRIGELKKVL